MAYNSKYTGAEVEALLDKVGDGGGALWNTYCFVGGAADSVVTIDGAAVDVAAGAVVQGVFTDDISAIPTNNLRRIIIRGDVSLTLCTSSSSANTTLEEVDIVFSPSFVRSLDYFCYNLRALRRLRVAGGRVSGAYYMCMYVGVDTDGGCVADLHGIDFSAMTSVNGCAYLCRDGKWESVDLSGCTFGGNANYLFRGATVGSADVAGCTFNGNANGLFCVATVGSADVAGCTFNGNVTYLLYEATIGSVDLGGSTFNGSDANWLCYGAVIRRLSLAAVDLSTAVSNSAVGWAETQIEALDLDGITLPPSVGDFVGGMDNETKIGTVGDFVGGMNNATKIGTITGDWGEVTGNRDLSALELRRNSTVGVFNALAITTVERTLTISPYSGARVTDYDIAIATNKGWTVAY